VRITADANVLVRAAVIDNLAQSEQALRFSKAAGISPTECSLSKGGAWAVVSSRASTNGQLIWSQQLAAKRSF
jgi:hypothetical protein